MAAMSDVAAADAGPEADFETTIRPILAASCLACHDADTHESGVRLDDVAAVPDAIQMPVERYLPRVVYNHLVDSYPKEKLLKILTYIALHPMEGPVLDDISDLGIEGAAGDPMLVRERAYLYAIKFIARNPACQQQLGNQIVLTARALAQIHIAAAPEPGLARQ